MSLKLFIGGNDKYNLFLLSHFLLQIGEQGLLLLDFLISVQKE